MNEKDFISRSAAIAAISAGAETYHECYSHGDIMQTTAEMHIDLLEEIPAASVEEIKCGVWVENRTEIACGVCGVSYSVEIVHMGPIRRCPSCGAVLDISSVFPDLKYDD